MPIDVVKISQEEHEFLMSCQSKGKTIGADKRGFPIAVEPASVTKEVETTYKIFKLEKSITPRRIRESILKIDGGWLADVDLKITALRQKNI